MKNHPNLSVRRGRSALAALAIGLLCTGLLASGTAGASVAAGASPARATANPLDDGPWAPFKANWEAVWKAYNAATGTNKALLAKIALRPRVMWLTSGTQDGNMAETTAKHIEYQQQGNPNVYAMLAVFGLYPNGEGRRKDVVSTAHQIKYRQWIDQMAAGIGDKRTIIVLEPDLAVAWGGWKPAVRFALTRYAAVKLGALKNTTVYLDGSDADWLAPTKAITMLRSAGIAYVDGIALGSTHYSSTSGNIRYGVDLIRRLNAYGITGKHLVIDTADNGRPFTPTDIKRKGYKGPLGNAPTCRTRASLKCVTLGIPPTTDVANPRWGLGPNDRIRARAFVDAYLWFGRPWLYAQASPFKMNRALAVAATTPY